jgi:hypothetical protein
MLLRRTVLTVADLIAELSRFDPALPIGLAVLYREGVFVDVHAADATHVDVVLADDGQQIMVWLVGSEPADRAPGVVMVRCVCGAVLPVVAGEQWPAVHDRCSDAGFSD